MDERWEATVDEAIAQDTQVERLTDDRIDAILRENYHETMHRCPQWPCPDAPDAIGDFGDAGDDLVNALIELRELRRTVQALADMLATTEDRHWRPEVRELLEKYERTTAS